MAINIKRKPMKKIYYLISIMAVVLGFSDVNVVTNSFADECIGKRRNPYWK